MAKKSYNSLKKTNRKPVAGVYISGCVGATMGRMHMGLTKCPRCELNYIREDERLCNVCRRQIRGEKDEVEELQNVCMECGENRALKGKELCAYCLGEQKRREKLEACMEAPPELDVELAQLDEIDVPGDSGIPQEDLREINEALDSDDDDFDLLDDEEY